MDLAANLGERMQPEEDPMLLFLLQLFGSMTLFSYINNFSLRSNIKLILPNFKVFIYILFYLFSASINSNKFKFL